MTSRHGFLTANDVTPYVVGSLSSKGGPLVVELPAASDKVSYFGTFVDAWQAPIADVGPPGMIKARRYSNYSNYFSLLNERLF